MSDPTPKKTKLELIESTPAAQMPELPMVADQFKQLFSIIHRNEAMADAFYEAEKFHFRKLINESAVLQSCTKLSLYGCFMDVAVNGLSFDPSFKHLYLVPFNVNAGTKDKPKWEKRAQLQISGPGELLLRTLQGQIKYADNPVLVYEGDSFTYGSTKGGFFVEHTSVLPRKSSTIIACYLKITRNDGTLDYKVITREDMDRFQKFSKEPNGKAWTDGEGGMWLTKCIKHSFKTYPKLRTGEFTKLETAEDVNHEELSPSSSETATSNTPEQPATSQPATEAPQAALSQAPIDYGISGDGIDFAEQQNGEKVVRRAIDDF